METSKMNKRVTTRNITSYIESELQKGTFSLKIEYKYDIPNQEGKFELDWIDGTYLPMIKSFIKKRAKGYPETTIITFTIYTYKHIRKNKLSSPKEKKFIIAKRLKRFL